MSKQSAILLALWLVFAGTPVTKAQEVSQNADTAQLVLTSSAVPAYNSPTLLTPEPKVTPVVVPKTLKEYAAEKIATAFAGESKAYDQFDYIVKHESNWNIKAVNPTSGACGLMQALPCVKPGISPTGVRVIDLSGEQQVDAMITYITNRYGTMSKAFAHKKAKGWY